MAERIILDPTEEVTGRTQFDLTPWISQEGPDWGEGAISAYTAELSRGASVVDFRVPNRTVEIPLILRALGGTSFATARALVQAKASLFQREGGRLRRTTTAGSTVYADVVNATLKLGGDWLQSAKDADLDATLSLECLPDFYEAEVQLSDHPETSLSELVFTETTVRGDYPARVRVVVDEDQGQSQLGLIWSFRNRHYSSASTAATRFEAEALNPLDTATRVALTGASGGTVVTHGTLSTNWTPVLDMRAGGTAYPTHTGTNRLWVRYRTTSGTAVQLRAVWDVGDLTLPVENTPIRCGAGTQLFMADFGELRLDPPPVGTHRWNGIIQAKGDAGGENVSLDKVWVLNADEGYGVLTAPLNSSAGLVPFSARDEFNQSAGALATKALAQGGTWTGAGDADDFTVDATFHRASRVAVSDTDLNTGRYARAGTGTATGVVVQCKVARGGENPTDNNHVVGIFCRYTDTSNWLGGQLQIYGGGAGYARVVKRVAGAVTHLDATAWFGGSATASTNFPLYVNTGYFVRLVVFTNGLWEFWFGLDEASATVILTGLDSDLATGGTLATGGYGIYDARNSAGVLTRTFDDFAVWAPVPDAVLNASQSAELRWDGMYREDTGGTAFGPVSQVVGDLPRLPPTVEGRTTEVFVKASRGNFAGLPDMGIDDASARLTYRPCWLTVPGT